MRLWGLSHKTSSMNVDDEPTGGCEGLLLRQVGELLGKGEGGEQEMEEVEEGEERERRAMEREQEGGIREEKEKEEKEGKKTNDSLSAHMCSISNYRHTEVRKSILE